MEKPTLKFTQEEIKDLLRYVPETTGIGRFIVLFMKRESNWDGETFWDYDWDYPDGSKRIPIGIWVGIRNKFLRGTNCKNIISIRNKISAAYRANNKYWKLTKI